MGWREWLGRKVTPTKFAELMIGRARGLGLGEFEYDADIKELRQSGAKSKWQLYLERVYEEYVLTPSKDRANVIDNLRSMTHPNGWTQLDANTWSGHWDGAYASSRMVTPEVIHQLGVPDPIVIVPTPDTLLVVSGRSENALASLAYWCEQPGGPDKRSLSSVAYRLNDRSWSAIPPAEQNTPEPRNFQLRGISSSHEEQKQLLDDLHSRTDQDIWVTIYQLMKKEDSSLITAYTMVRPALMSALVALSLLAAPPASASEAANGQFRPSRSCEAYLSFAKGTNPGQVKVVPGAEYEIREVNTREARWLRIQIPDVKEPLRWVAAECGIASGLTFSPGPTIGDNSCSLPGKHDSYVLAVTWQPGFCEHFKYNGKKPECENMADGRLVVSNLTLHGLWPNRKQCGTKYADCGTAPLSLSKDTVSYISPWMPNFYYQTTFGSYEWKKHGTCQSTMDADTYFRRAVNAVRTVNDSTVGQYIRANVGGRISRAEFLKRFGEATGLASPRDHVGLLCAGEYLQEIRIRLPLDFKEGAGMRELIGTPTSAGSLGASCPEDIRIEASGKN